MRSISSSVSESARQAQPVLEEAFGYGTAHRWSLGEDRLQVHRLPAGPGLDVLGVESPADVVAGGAEPLGSTGRR